MISKRFDFNPTSILKLNDIQVEAKKKVEYKIQSGKYKFEMKKCQVCDSSTHEELAKRDRYGLQHTTVICSNCGLVYTNPQMSLDSYDEFYNSEYRDLYVGSSSTTDLFFKRQIKKGQSIYNYIKENSDVVLNDKTKVLEIGCGAGGILQFFKQKGCCVKGIDIGGKYLEYGIEKHSLDLTKGTLHTLDLKFKPDIIIYSHVLEHITELNAEIGLIKKIISLETLLYIEVPGMKMIHKTYKRDFLLYLQNAHTFCFSLSSLNNLLSKNGFKLLKGNESIQSIFVPHENIKSRHTNDLEPTIEYLQKIEKSRRLYFFSIINLKNRFKTLIIYILTKIGLKQKVAGLLNKN
jgi:SAM-dependent methyltransferase